MSRSCSPEGARNDNHSVERHREKKTGALAQVAKCATVPIGHLCLIKALITSACLKHFNSHKLDNWIETSSTAVHVKPFSRIERIKHLGSTNLCPTADAKRV